MIIYPNKCTTFNFTGFYFIPKELGILWTCFCKLPKGSLSTYFALSRSILPNCIGLSLSSYSLSFTFTCMFKAAIEFSQSSFNWVMCCCNCTDFSFTHRILSYGDLKWTLKWILVHIHSIIQHFHCLFVNCTYFFHEVLSQLFCLLFFVITEHILA